jgi:ABC-type phosphate transport system substrate-binding protein
MRDNPSSTSEFFHKDGAILLVRHKLLVFVLAMSSVPLARAKDVALVSNKANETESISLPELIKVCKGQTNHWPDGKPVTFIMLDPASPEMRVVLQKVYDATAEQVKSLITAANHGRANHPAIIIVGSDEALVQKVESLPGAIGLVDVYSITGRIDVVRVAGKLPLEPGYLLHGN